MVGLGLFGNFVNVRYEKRHSKTRSKSVSYKMSLIWEMEI